MIRFFDIVFSSFAIIILFPFMIPVMLGLKLTGEHYIFYTHPRVGRGGKEFNILKFATMLNNSPNLPGGVLTQKNDFRILPMGKFLRKTKINELPQLINIFLGQMSIIGPRPQAKLHYDLYSDDVKKAIDSISPGLSGIGSIVFRNEEKMLDHIQGDRDQFHDVVIAPYKGELEVWYSGNRGIVNYFLLIFLTIWVMVKPQSDMHFRLFKKLPPVPDKLKTVIRKPYIIRKLIRDIIQWDVESWSATIKYWDQNIDWNSVDNCLELGGREGGLSLWLALKGKKIICSDLDNVQQNAKPLHKKYALTELITYEDIDATNIPYENHFDVIIFKSIIGGIGRNNILDQQKVFTEIHKALKPGGKLLFAENLVGSPMHQFFRKKFVKWGNSWRYVKLHEMKHFLLYYKSYKIKTTGVSAVFGRNELQRNVLAAIDRLVLNFVCPDKWKYISFGIAEKL